MSKLVFFTVLSVRLECDVDDNLCRDHPQRESKFFLIWLFRRVNRTSNHPLVDVII